MKGFGAAECKENLFLFAANLNLMTAKRAFTRSTINLSLLFIARCWTFSRRRRMQSGRIRGREAANPTSGRKQLISINFNSLDFAFAVFCSASACVRGQSSLSIPFLGRRRPHCSNREQITRETNYDSGNSFT